MNVKRIIISLFLILSLASCNNKEEAYEKRDVKVDTVFDNITVSYSEIENNENLNSNNQNNQSNENSNQNSNIEDTSNISNNIGIITTSVNLRETPTTDEDNFIMSLSQNTSVNVLEEVEENGESWTKISYNNQEGYVKSEYIQQ